MTCCGLPPLRAVHAHGKDVVRSVDHSDQPPGKPNGRATQPAHNPFNAVLHGEAQMSGACQAIFAKVVRMLCGAS
jgi:hypothetical protein